MHVGFVVLLVFVVSCTCSNFRACLEHRCLFLIEARWPQSFWLFVFTKPYTICHICLLNPAFLFCTLHCQSLKAPVDNPLIGYHSQHIHLPIILIQNIAGKNRWGMTKESKQKQACRLEKFSWLVSARLGNKPLLGKGACSAPSNLFGEECRLGSRKAVIVLLS